MADRTEDRGSRHGRNQKPNPRALEGGDKVGEGSLLDDPSWLQDEDKSTEADAESVSVAVVLTEEVRNRKKGATRSVGTLVERTYRFEDVPANKPPGLMKNVTLRMIQTSETTVRSYLSFDQKLKYMISDKNKSGYDVWFNLRCFSDGFKEFEIDKLEVCRYPRQCRPVSYMFRKDHLLIPSNLIERTNSIRLTAHFYTRIHWCG